MSTWLWDKVESLRRFHVARPLQNDQTGQFQISNGRLQGTGVFFSPTGTKFYQRPSLWVRRPCAVVLHYTGCHARNRPLKDFDKLVNRADERLKDTEGSIINLKLKCEEVGYIPDAVSLCLQNATRARMASWCLLVGSQPLPDGKLPIAQYSPNMDTCGTMHAGTPSQLWRARKTFGKKPFETTRGEIRWNGRNYRWPAVEVPGTNGESLVISNVNPYVIGIEMMNVGIYGTRKKIQYPGLPTIQIGKRLYERPSALMVETLREILKAIREQYGDIPVWGHQDITRTKIDPWPPFPRDL